MNEPRNTFFDQTPVRFDTSVPEIGGFDILGIPEAPSAAERPYKTFEIKTSITIGEVIKRLNASDLSISESNGAYVVADMKQEYILRDIALLRKTITDEFSKELPAFSGAVVQFVKTPLSFFDYAPGDTQIAYKIFTERCLGILEND